MFASEDFKVRTINDIEKEIIDLKSKNKTVFIVQGGLSFAGSVGGLIYAIKKNKSFWGKVGFWILGGLIVTVPSGIAANLINNRRNTDIKKLELEKQQKQQYVDNTAKLLNK